METDVERAELADRRRGLVAPFIGLLVITANQWLFFSRDWTDVAIWQLGLWLILVLLAFFLLMTGGLWFLPMRVRQIANDEVTRNSRQKAIQAGFVAAMLIAPLVFVVSPFEPLAAQRAAHLVISISLEVAFLVYGIAEIRHCA